MIEKSFSVDKSNYWVDILSQNFTYEKYCIHHKVYFDLSDIDFIILKDWIRFISIITLYCKKNDIINININFKSKKLDNVIPYKNISSIEHGNSSNVFISSDDIRLSKQFYYLLRFVESIGTSKVISLSTRPIELSYSNILRKDIDNIKHIYTSKSDDDYTVILGLTRITTKDDCIKFLDENNIMNWRESMKTSFIGSPLLESDEIWRIICHELSANVWEHAGETGYIAMRIVKPVDDNDKLKWWCEKTYENDFKNVVLDCKLGFLEILISDSGDGIVKSLEAAYRKFYKIDSMIDVNAKDVIEFAFNEYGTSKSNDESWATERHALGRILKIVAKYGGGLSVTSDGKTLYYVCEKGVLPIDIESRWFTPTNSVDLPSASAGVCLQIILPIYPANKEKIFESQNDVDYFKDMPPSIDGLELLKTAHQIPLAEYIEKIEAGVGRDDQRKFRIACESLCRRLLHDLPATEPVVLDFYDINWTTGQFETLLYYLQNLIQNRPCLLVNLEENFIKNIILEEDDSTKTYLDNIQNIEIDTNIYIKKSSIFENKFLDTYRYMHTPILTVDQNGSLYLLGLPSRVYEKPLLNLLDNKLTLDEIVETNEFLNINFLMLILDAQTSYLFKQISDKWTCIWSKRQIDFESKIAISRHFDIIVEKCHALRGTSGTKELFNLPWQQEWVSEFLECSRIFSNQRYLDEAAHRLIFRLEYGLKLIGKKFSDVKVLTCVTTPALLLTTAIHRWWPKGYEKPAITDMGYQIFLGTSESSPVVPFYDGIVIIQDILDKGNVTNKILETLKVDKRKILCVIGFVKLVNELVKTRVIPVSEWWSVDKREYNIPKHALIEFKRPNKASPPNDDEDDYNAYWVEPRSLRPIRYPSLRREFPPGKDLDLDRRDVFLELFDSYENGCLFAAGHYVYGRRHYSVAVDTKKVIGGQIGDMFSEWIADICQGRSRSIKDRKPWESDEGFSLSGDISAVLLPLHSQIHNIWPKISEDLVRRGRKQSVWFLEATMFSGKGQTYILPYSFASLIKYTVGRIIDGDSSSRLRILILDDTIASGRTIETILNSISREVEKSFLSFEKDIKKYENPVEYIRYSVILNQMGESHNFLWKNIKFLGEKYLRVVLESFAPFMGVPVYDVSDCPKCKDIERLHILIRNCEHYGDDFASKWVKRRLLEISPIPIESLLSGSKSPCCLNRAIDPLAPRRRPRSTTARYIPRYVDTLIWRFYELMYLSYPPSDILNSLDFAFPRANDTLADIADFERYRFTVLEWCIKNWPRVVASNSEQKFVVCFLKEVSSNTNIVPSLLEMISLISNEQCIINAICTCINLLYDYEKARQKLDRSKENIRIDKTLSLELGLSLYFYNIEYDLLLKQSSFNEVTGIYERLIDILEKKSSDLDTTGHNLIRNIHRRLTRPSRSADPAWALKAVAESLFRGRDNLDKPFGHHQLLPKLIQNIIGRKGNQEDIVLLQGCLGLFLAGLKDLLPYVELNSTLSTAALNVIDLSERVLDWLKKVDVEDIDYFPREIRYLENEILLESKFMTDFECIFQQPLLKIAEFLNNRSIETGDGRLKFESEFIEDVLTLRPLVHIQSLQICIANWAIDHIVKVDTNHKSKVVFSSIFPNYGPARINIEIFTNYNDTQTTNYNVRNSLSSNAGITMLEKFGCTFSDTWSDVAPAEAGLGFLTSFNFTIPTGFIKGGDV